MFDKKLLMPLPTKFSKMYGIIKNVRITEKIEIVKIEILGQRKTHNNRITNEKQQKLKQNTTLLHFFSKNKSASVSSAVSTSAFGKL
jgi:hypothetical protein